MNTKYRDERGRKNDEGLRSENEEDNADMVKGSDAAAGRCSEEAKRQVREEG